MILIVLVLCLDGAAQYGTYQRCCGQGGHPRRIESVTACQCMVFCKHDIARILQFFAPILLLLSDGVLFLADVSVNLYLSPCAMFIVYSSEQVVGIVMHHLKRFV